MTAETLHLALWIIGGCTVAIVGAVVWLATLVFRIGQKYGVVETEIGEFKKSVAEFKKASERLERIPILEIKVDQLAMSSAEERRRFASEWPELREKVTTLWERVFSLQNWRKSQGQYGNGNGE